MDLSALQLHEPGLVDLVASALADLPFDVLKVDRRWTRRRRGTCPASRLATGAFRLAEATGLLVIAEGRRGRRRARRRPGDGVRTRAGPPLVAPPAPADDVAARLLPRPALPVPRRTGAGARTLTRS